jgi:hypothetical protein
MNSVVPAPPPVEELLAVVEASPAAVAAHDKQRWLDLWSRYHVVEDPVGSRPVLGGIYDRRSGGRVNGPLSRFWDTFIARNEISFDVVADYADGWDVVRDVTIHTTLPGGASLAAPAHLLYELVSESGEVKIKRMAAHWSVAPAFAQVLRPTRRHLTGIAAMSSGLLRHLGPVGAVRFAGAAFGVGGKGVAAVRGLVSRAERGDADALARLGGAVPSDLTKVIASGDTVAARCVVRDSPSALVATVNRRTLEVARAKVYLKIG